MWKETGDEIIYISPEEALKDHFTDSSDIDLLGMELMDVNVHNFTEKLYDHLNECRKDRGRQFSVLLEAYEEMKGHPIPTELVEFPNLEVARDFCKEIRDKWEIKEKAEEAQKRKPAKSKGKSKR